MEFTGLEPWPENVELIECVSAARTFDLHNFSDFTGLEWLPEGELRLHFVFRDDWHPPPARVSLSFEDVRTLSVLQDPEFAPQAATEVDGWSHRGVAGGRSAVRFDLTELVLEFTAARVTLTTQPLP